MRRRLFVGAAVGLSSPSLGRLQPLQRGSQRSHADPKQKLRRARHHRDRWERDCFGLSQPLAVPCREWNLQYLLELSESLDHVATKIVVPEVYFIALAATMIVPIAAPWR